LGHIGGQKICNNKIQISYIFGPPAIEWKTPLTLIQDFCKIFTQVILDFPKFLAGKYFPWKFKFPAKKLKNSKDDLIGNSLKIVRKI
jgi:hypothetical protein